MKRILALAVLMFGLSITGYSSTRIDGGSKSIATNKDGQPLATIDTSQFHDILITVTPAEPGWNLVVEIYFQAGSNQQVLLTKASQKDNIVLPISGAVPPKLFVKMSASKIGALTAQPPLTVRWNAWGVSEKKPCWSHSEISYIYKYGIEALFAADKRGEGLELVAVFPDPDKRPDRHTFIFKRPIPCP